jgi:hypothetical protein
MQTKILISLFTVCVSLGAAAQQSFYTSTKNQAGLPEKETSFTLSLVPDNTAAAFGLYVINPENKKIELQIIHLENGVVVDTSFTSEKFHRRYNFEQVDDGRYQVTLVSGKEKITKTVEINTVTSRNTVIR